MSETYDQMMADETEVGAMVRRLLPDRLDQNERNGFEFIWEYQARSQQLPPPGDWRAAIPLRAGRTWSYLDHAAGRSKSRGCPIPA